MTFSETIRRWFTNRRVILACAVSLLTAATASAGYLITDIGSIGTFTATPSAINDAGQVAWSTSPSLGNFHAYLYSSGHSTDLGSLGFGASAAGINAAGEVVGYSMTPTGDRAFLYSNGTMKDISGHMNGLAYAGPFMSTAAGINASGQVAGSGTMSDLSTHALLYSNGKFTDLGVLGAPKGGFAFMSNSTSSGINNAGVVVGSSSTSDGAMHAFLWSNGTMKDLGGLGGTQMNGHISIVSGANAINNLGQVVGQSSISTGMFGQMHAFLYSSGKMIDLGTLAPHDPTGGYSAAGAINDHGQVVGASTTGSHALHAFIFSNGTMTDLNSLIDPKSGWTLWGATGINNKGQIVAFATRGTVPQGISGTAQADWHVVELTPQGSSPPPRGTPEPASLTLVGLGLLGLAGYGWRRRG